MSCKTVFLSIYHGLSPILSVFLHSVPSQLVDHFFYNDQVGKQLAAKKEFCVKYWWQKLQVSIDRCTGRCDITKLML